MGWLWLLFLVFTVLSNLMEKVAKEKRSSNVPRKDQGGGSPAPRPVAFPPFFFEEFEEEREKPLLVEEVNAEQEVTTRSQLELPKASTGQPRTNRGQRMVSFRDDEFEQVSMADLEMTGFSKTLEEDTGRRVVPTERKNIQVERESEEFLAAIVLAQVMARPDFKTIPWQRKL